MQDHSFDPRQLNADLHCHSFISDGTLSPAAVAARAAQFGVQLWSLTDHDEVAGQIEAARAAREFGLSYVDGVEISVTWAHETIHVIGLRVDSLNAELVEGLAKTRCGRERRAREIGARLEAIGIEGGFAGALARAGNPDLISRTHFARFLVETGVCVDMQEVFAQYLVAGKPGYVPMRWATLGEAVQWIIDAGGVAVVAHPGRYSLSALEMDALLGEFKEHGGTGLEVITGSHTPSQYREYAEVATRFGFLASRGSDFHDPIESRAELGSLPPLPQSLVPIWHDWF